MKKNALLEAGIKTRLAHHFQAVIGWTYRAAIVFGSLKVRIAGDDGINIFLHLPVEKVVGNVCKVNIPRLEPVSKFKGLFKRKMG